MLKIAKIVFVPAMLLSVWLIMNETISVFLVIIGVFVTAFSIIITDRLFDIKYTKMFFLPPLTFLGYMLFVLKEIYINGIKAAIMIIKGDVEPIFVTKKIDSEIKNRFLHDILSASITLTPGTVTIKNEDGYLTILSMHPKEDDPTQCFTPFLKEIEKRSKKYEK